MTSSGQPMTSGDGGGEPARTRLPKLCGTDIELGNFILGLDQPSGTCYEASRALLREIDGFPHARPYRPSTSGWYGGGCRDSSGYGSDSVDSPGSGHGGGYGGSSLHGGLYGGRSWYGGGYAQGGFLRYASSDPSGYDVQDWGRKFLANGACVYVDLDHLELASAETLSGFDQVACVHAMLRLARRALDAANAKQPRGRKIQVLANNSDGLGNSYGSHVNFLITRQAWENLFHRRLQYMLYLAAFQASSIVYTGQGKVGSENGQPPTAFQLSQRADYIESLTGPQTTYRRPLINSRDESLTCGSRGGSRGDRGMARLHVIFFDNTLCHVATLLKVGVMQIVLSMIEAGRVNLDLILDDPIAAVVGWSHDPTLQARAELTSGTRLTAVELQMRFLEDAQRFVAEGGCEGIVPRADEILAIWERTLTTFDRGEIATLAPQLDWVLKLSILRRAMEQRSNFTWESPQIKHLDHIFSSLDPAEGLYWAYERSGFVERIASEDEIAYFTEHPPENTRAWTRGTLLRRAGADAVEDVEWDWIRLRETGAKRWRYTRELSLASPLEWTRTMSQPVFEQSVDLDEILDGLDRLQADEDRERPERPAGQLKTVGWAGY